jgi:tetratricopeptide (TPR) repeat protein
MRKPAPQDFSGHLVATVQQAAELHRQGRLTEAEKLYARVLKSVPDQPEALQLMAQLKLARGKPADARNYAAAAVRARPGAADPLVVLGHVQRSLRQDDAAIASFEKALALDPHHVDALGCLGDALLTRGRPEQALQCFDRILARIPQHADAHANRAAALAACGRFAEALAACEAALALAPGNPIALYNRANALASLDRHAEALAAYEKVVGLYPQHAAAWNNRGNSLMALKRHGDAIDSFERAIALQPKSADAHFNRSLALLAVGDYARGFAEYEWRWKRSGMPAQRSYGRLWRGDFPLADRTILVSSEQGLGDTIQFARYVPLLARSGATVILEVHPELKSLLSRLPGAAQVVARGEPLSAFDVHCPAGSLPLALKTELPNVPAEIPYLKAEEARVAEWRPRLEALKPPRVALAWAGNPNHANDRNRSIALARLRPLWEAGGARFVSVQREVRETDAAELEGARGILHLGEELRDLDDTAALLALCDVVMSVDTAVAHLAAAMGRPTWVLLPFAPDWRWTLDGERSPWYPAARLFRQPQAGDWDSVIARVVAELGAVAPCVG